MFGVILGRGKFVMIELKAQFKSFCCGFKHPQAFGYYFFTAILKVFDFIGCLFNLNANLCVHKFSGVHQARRRTRLYTTKR